MRQTHNMKAPTGIAATTSVDGTTLNFWSQRGFSVGDRVRAGSQAPEPLRESIPHGQRLGTIVGFSGTEDIECPIKVVFGADRVVRFRSYELTWVKGGQK